MMDSIRWRNPDVADRRLHFHGLLLDKWRRSDVLDRRRGVDGRLRDLLNKNDGLVGRQSDVGLRRVLRLVHHLLRLLLDKRLESGRLAGGVGQGGQLLGCIRRHLDGLLLLDVRDRWIQVRLGVDQLLLLVHQDGLLRLDVAERLFERLLRHQLMLLDRRSHESLDRSTWHARLRLKVHHGGLDVLAGFLDLLADQLDGHRLLVAVGRSGRGGIGQSGWLGVRNVLLLGIEARRLDGLILGVDRRGVVGGRRGRLTKLHRLVERRRLLLARHVRYDGLLHGILRRRLDAGQGRVDDARLLLLLLLDQLLLDLMADLLETGLLGRLLLLDLLVHLVERLLLLLDLLVDLVERLLLLVDLILNQLDSLQLLLLGRLGRRHGHLLRHQVDGSGRLLRHDRLRLLLRSWRLLLLDQHHLRLFHSHHGGRRLRLNDSHRRRRPSRLMRLCQRQLLRLWRLGSWRLLDGGGVVPLFALLEQLLDLSPQQLGHHFDVLLHKNSALVLRLFEKEKEN